MASVTVPKVTLYVLNVIYAIFGLAIAAASIWFFCQVHEFTSLRNSNHYLLDYNVYWPQAVPWIFFIAALFVLGVCCCGFMSAKKKSRGLLAMYMVLLCILMVVLIAASVIAFVFADSKSTENFVKDVVWDAYGQAKTDVGVETSFSEIERKLHCCGADGPRDYKNWKEEFPRSCCDTYYHGFQDAYPIECEFSNKLANERHGCAVVAVQYTKIAIMVLSSASIFIAFIGIISLVAAVALSRALAKRRNRPPPQHESDSKKVLL